MGSVPAPVVGAEGCEHAVHDRACCGAGELLEEDGSTQGAEDAVARLHRKRADCIDDASKHAVAGSKMIDGDLTVVI